MPSGREERLVAEPVGETMTIGELSERSGVAVKQLRRYEDLGFIYTVGRSAANYRLFDQTALWCVGLVTTWRSLGLTLAEIGEITEAYLADPTANVGPMLAERLRTVRQRTATRIEELRARVERIDAFEKIYRAELAGEADLRRDDPRFHADA